MLKNSQKGDKINRGKNVLIEHLIDWINSAWLVKSEFEHGHRSTWLWLSLHVKLNSIVVSMTSAQTNFSVARFGSYLFRVFCPINLCVCVCATSTLAHCKSFFWCFHPGSECLYPEGKKHFQIDPFTTNIPIISI